MKRFLLLACLLAAPLRADEPTVAAPPPPSPAETELGAYLFVFFTDPTHGIFFATSHDGYTFTAVNGGRPVFEGADLGEQKGVRDPHIARGPDGAFYLAMTDLHLFAKEKGLRTTQWERDDKQFGWGNNRGLVLMKSKDLIHWSRTILHVGEDFPEFANLGCIWAPATIYDPAAGKMLMTFTIRLGNGRTKLYAAHTDEAFTKLVEAPRLLFEYPNEKVQVLDSDLTRLPDGRYCLMYVAQEHPGGIRLAFSDRIDGGYTFDPRWVDAEPGACEAPNVWKRIGEHKWVLMYDSFSRNPHNFGFCETTDFVTFRDLGHFNDGVMKATNFVSPKHGAIIPVTKAEAQRVEQHWKAAAN